MARDGRRQRDRARLVHQRRRRAETGQVDGDDVEADRERREHGSHTWRAEPSRLHL
jgi:hypothetical protein